MLFPDWKAVRRILAIRLDNIGDVVMLSPALRALRLNFPEASISLMASPAGSQVAPLLPWIDNVITWKAVWQDVSGKLPDNPSLENSLIRQLSENSFDAVFIFTSFSQSPFPAAYACLLAGIPIRVGHSKEFGGSLLTLTSPPPPDEGHQADRNLALLEMVGLPLVGRDLELVVPGITQTESDHLLRLQGIDPLQPFIVVAPGASCAARRYAPHRFAQMILKLANQVDYPLVLVGTEKEKHSQKAVVETTSRFPNRVFSFFGDTTVPELAAIISRSRLVVTNNSAALHMADAFRIPTVCLYAGTEYLSQWRPRSSESILLRQETACSPCYRFDCPFDQECLDVSASEVVIACLDLLASTEMAYPSQVLVSQQLWQTREVSGIG